VSFYVPISNEAVRDLASSLNTWFSSAEIVEEFGVSRATARKYLSELVEAGTLERTGQTKGTRYRLAPMNLPFGPPRAPRSSPAPSSGHARGQVPYTGQPIGPSGKPGRDKKKARGGHRVKRARQGS
jgi:DeoR-like helix-turn-helix domain